MLCTMLLTFWLQIWLDDDQNIEFAAFSKCSSLVEIQKLKG